MKNKKILLGIGGALTGIFTLCLIIYELTKEKTSKIYDYYDSIDEHGMRFSSKANKILTKFGL